MKTLPEQFMAAKKRLSLIQNRIDEAKSKEWIPQQKKKFEGKYFTYDNCFSGGSPRWKVFYKVLGVEDVWIIREENFGTRVKVFMFQECPENGTRKVEYGIETVNDNMLQSPSTKRAFDAAWERLVNRIQITEP